MNKISRLTVLVTVLLFCAAAAYASGAHVVNKSSLLLKAASKGKVLIIADFEAENYSKLAKTSASFGTATPSGKLPAEALKADAALKASVSKGADAVLSSISGTDYNLVRRYSFIPALALEASVETINALANNPRVTYIKEDIPRPLPPVTKVDAPTLADSVPQINADDVWNMGYTGKDWYVAILDTGIRSSHEFFTGKDIVEVCFSYEGNCPNGQTSMTGTGAAAHYPSSYAGYSHGTHVAGIAAGKKSDGTMSGVAKDADIIAMQVFSMFEQDQLCGEDQDGNYKDCVLSYNSDQMQALNWLYENRANYSIASANLSLGGGQYSEFCDTSNPTYKSIIDNLISADIATLIASGNDGYCAYVNSPACISTAIAVGAVTKQDVETEFTNSHPTMVDIFAPGASILSAVPTSDTDYEAWNGTSMATPHIAGAWALFRDRNSGASVSTIETLLKQYDQPVNMLCDEPSDAGRVDVLAVVNNLQPDVDISAPYNIDITINESSAYTNTRDVTYSISAQDNTGVTGYYISESNTEPTLGSFNSVTSTTNYSGTVSGTLSEGDGLKTVYVFFRDAEGNIGFSSDTITLDTTAPVVSSIDPADGAVNVSRDVRIEVTFSETINGVTIGDNSFFLQSITPVAHKVSLSATSLNRADDSDTYYFIPNEELYSGTSYRLSITTDIEDLAGNSMAELFTSSFTTIANVESENVSTDNGTLTVGIGAGDFAGAPYFNGESYTIENYEVMYDGGLEFSVYVSPGSATTVTLSFPEIPDNPALFKCDGGSCSKINSVFSGKTATYTLVDGGSLDEDGAENGIIVDPVVLAGGDGSDDDDDTGSGGGGGGGCSAADNSSNGFAWLLLALSAVLFRRKRA
ncbi:S8 family serine peptidase [Limisalsivibrio acetivorans]|uniref:S8 family serine peptidase n=1 Tax=Limisalsivibrio acetivorans TaxID=1304888 RepID=UPI0003B44294|nr:S8 family serine peptidase [Limisalsivibrio acetivorans]